MSKFQVFVLGSLFILACMVFSAIGGAFFLMQPPRSDAPVNNQPTTPPQPTSTPRPTNTPAPTPTPVILRFEGASGKVVGFRAPAGPIVVYGWHIGESNFIATVHDEATGDLVGVPINCIGDCEDESLVRLPAAGDYLIEVTADAAWAILVSVP